MSQSSLIVQSVLDALQALSAWEATAVVLALAYLVLVIRQNVLAWPAALVSAGIYLVLMFEAKLYLQSILQLFYAGLAVYGWWNWQRGGDENGLPVRRWGWRQHGVALAIIAVSGALVGWIAAGTSDAAFPYLDAWVACGAVVTTAMVARKILENWHYWFRNVVTDASFSAVIKGHTACIIITFSPTCSGSLIGALLWLQTSSPKHYTANPWFSERKKGKFTPKW